MDIKKYKEFTVEKISELRVSKEGQEGINAIPGETKTKLEEVTDMFKKVLIANRGEIAVRIIKACQEMGIKTVAVYSEVDKNAPHVQIADESINLGDPTPSESYLNIAKIIENATKVTRRSDSSWVWVSCREP